MMPSALLVAHAAATWFMAGLIWFVQVVHYPLMARVGEVGYAAYQAGHTARTGLVVGPPMLLEAATATVLVLLPAGSGPPMWSRWLGLGLLAVVWVSTAVFSVPRHGQLAGGFDAGAHAALVSTNWIRTLAWTARAGLAAWMIARA
jgi:hypothetical protein